MILSGKSGEPFSDWIPRSQSPQSRTNPAPWTMALHIITLAPPTTKHPAGSYVMSLSWAISEMTLYLYFSEVQPLLNHSWFQFVYRSQSGDAGFVKYRRMGMSIYPHQPLLKSGETNHLPAHGLISCDVLWLCSKCAVLGINKLLRPRHTYRPESDASHYTVDTII